jgi:predicted HAD superfamily Cof-like phosphohydrolase
MDYIKKVKEFHQNFNHPVEETPTEDVSISKLRISLLFEELKELAAATQCEEHLKEITEEFIPQKQENYNKKETLDALGDLQYILSGSVVSMGYKNVFEEAFDRIHKSNMSKMCRNKQEALFTIRHHQTKGETKKMEIQQKNGKYIVVREDGKIMKSINYQKVDLENLV